MKLIIDISEETYIKANAGILGSFGEIIANGTPFTPEGDAISRQAAKDRIKAICEEYCLSYEDGERKAATGGSAYALGHAFDDLPSVFCPDCGAQMDERLMKIADHYGLDPQLNMLQEECAELIQAVSKYKRANCTDDHLAEEIADVYIMLEQIQYLLELHKDVNDWVDIKVKRQLQRMEGDQPC